MIPRVYGSVGKPLVLQGRAYDFGHAIIAIQFSLDKGENWTTYPVENTNDYENLSWELEFTPEVPGFYIMYIRSVNDRNETSPESAYVELEIE